MKDTVEKSKECFQIIHSMKVNLEKELEDKLDIDNLTSREINAQSMIYQKLLTKDKLSKTEPRTAEEEINLITKLAETITKMAKMEHVTQEIQSDIMDDMIFENSKPSFEILNDLAEFQKFKNDAILQMSVKVEGPKKYYPTLNYVLCLSASRINDNFAFFQNQDNFFEFAPNKKVTSLDL